MDRLIATNSVPQAQADTAPASGTPEYATDGNPATGVLATQWPAYQYNAIQEELIALISAGGLTPDKTNNGQAIASLLSMFRDGKAIFAVDTNTGANTITINRTPKATALANGMPVMFKAANTNTGVTNISIDGKTAIPLYGAGLPLSGGEIIAGGFYVATYDSTNNRCNLVGQSVGSVPVSAGKSGNHAANLGQLVGANGSSNSGTNTIIQTSVSFTPDTNDVVLVLLSVGTNSGTASAAITQTGATVLSNGGNFTAGMGVAMAMLKCTAGSPVTITGTAQNSSSATMSAYLSYLKIASS